MLEMDASLEIPPEVPIIVLSQAVLFPHALLPLHIFEERYRTMLQYALQESRIFGVAQTVEWENPSLPVPDLTETMGIGFVRACVGRLGGTSDLILQGISRVRIVGETQSEPFRMVRIEPVITHISNAAEVRQLALTLREQSRALGEHGYELPQKMDQYLEKEHDPEIIGDLMAAAFVENGAIRQDILETVDLAERLEIILAAMKLLETH